MCAAKDLYALYKPWRNKLASMGRRESLYVVWAYSQLATIRDFRMPADITVPAGLGRHPASALNLWELETIAGEIVLNGGEAAKGKHTLKDGNQLLEIVQGLRTLEDEIYGAQEDADVLVEVWRISHRQFTYQQKRMTPQEVIRYYMIYSDPAIDAICQARLGLSVFEIFFIVLLFLGVFLEHPRQALPVRSDIVEFPAEKIDKFLQFASSDVASVAKLIKSTHKIDESYAYRYSALRQFPLQRERYGGKDELLCPMPVLVQWRAHAGLYFALVGDQGFANALGDSFERVCGEILRRGLPEPAFTVDRDAEYGTRNRPRRTPDWIVTRAEEPDAALVVECKTTRTTRAGREGLNDLEGLRADIAKLSDAVVQVYARIAEYKQNLWPQLPYRQQRTLYPVVTTLEDWYLLGPRVHGLLDEMITAAMRAEGIDANLLQEAPYAVVSVNDMERLVQIIAAHGIDAVMAAKLRNPEKRTELWHGFMNDLAQGMALLPTLFQREYEELVDVRRFQGSANARAGNPGTA